MTPHDLGPVLVPDPARYRQSLPGSFWRRWERGEYEGRADFWRQLARTWGEPFVERVLRGEAAYLGRESR